MQHTCIGFVILSSLCQLSLPLEYAPSRHYSYHYTTHVAFNEPHLEQQTQAKKDVGFQFNAEVKLSPVWNTNNKMLVKLEINKPEIQSLAWSQSKLQAKTLSKYPLYFHWEGSRVVRVYTASKDPVWSANIKIGVASLLQLQRDTGTREEVDISGVCDVHYQVEGDVITKTKTNCQASHDQPEYQNAHQILGVEWKSSSQLRYDIKDDIIQSVQGTETYHSKVNMQQSVAAMATLGQTLTLSEVVSGSGKVQASTLEEAVVVISTREKLDLSVAEPTAIIPNSGCWHTECTGCAHCQQLSEIVAKHSSNLESGSAASPEAASAFLNLVAGVRLADRDAITALLQDHNNQDILLALIDAITAAQTSSGQAALLSFLDFQETYDISLAERYLLAVAFSTHPSEQILTDLFNLYEGDIPDDRLRDSVGDAMGAVLNTFCRQGNQDAKIVSDIQSAVLRKLSSCSSEACSCMQLRVLANAGLASSLPTLLQKAEYAKSAAVSEAAIQALRRIHPKFISTEARHVLLRIYLQEKRSYDSAVRTAALKMLLSAISGEEVAATLKSTSEPGQGELAMFVQARLQTAAKTNHTIRQFIASAMMDPSLSNYDVLAPKGKSLAFKESMADTGNMMATYDMFVENSKSGIMKRSGMDVDMHAVNQTLPLYSFGIFASGLEGLLGEEVEPGQEEVEATAGLALNLLDVSLRPVTFFTGQSGLMSAVWNAPSELMSALQANLLLQDTASHVPLLNGLVLRHSVQGAVSMDLSGLVSISLWNKNCHSLIKNSGALAVHGSLALENEAFQTGIAYTASGASVIDFMTDVDFYDKIKMCLQMGRPASTFRHDVYKYESATGFKKGYSAQLRRSTGINAASYPLPKPNNNQCRALLADGS